MPPPSAAIPSAATPRKRAYLIDSSIYIFRAWYLFEPTILDKEGRPVNAVAGFSDFLWQVMSRQRPTLIACAFDESQVRSYRRELYPDYKANRAPAPLELKRQFSLCREFCAAIGVPSFGSDRFEADDLLASLAARLRREGHAITVVSADKDLAQLVLGEYDMWWDFARGIALDRHGVRKHFGVAPEQIADMLALSGDKVDNIAGVPGVGAKMAAKLLQKFPGLDSLLENLDEVARMKLRGAPRIHTLLKAHRHRLPLNKRLTSLVCDLDLAADDLAWKGVDTEALAGLCERLAMSPSLHRRWLSLSVPA